MVADIEELEEMDASEIHARRLNAKEVLTPMKNETSYSQSQMEQPQSLVREQRLRTATLTMERRERGEEQEILQRTSDAFHSPTPFQEDSARDDEAPLKYIDVTRKLLVLMMCGMWKFMSDAANNKAKRKRAVEKPKLDNANQFTVYVLH